MQLEPHQITTIATLPDKIQRNLNLADRLYCAIRAVNDAHAVSFGYRVRVARQEAVAPLLRALKSAHAYAHELRKAAEAIRYEVRNTGVIEIAERAARIEHWIDYLTQKAEKETTMNIITIAGNPDAQAQIKAARDARLQELEAQ